MKLKRILWAIMFVCFPFVVYAAGGMSVSTSSMNITNGGSGTFRITVSNGQGRVDIASSNPGVATVSSSSEWLDSDSKSSVTITVRAKSIGTAAITVRAVDMATYDGEVIGNSYTINVNVAEAKSGNTSLSKLEVEGYELVKVSDNDYILTVSNLTTSVNVIAQVADEKSIVQGGGVHDLNVGENVILVVVTAQNGATRTYNVIVTRKDDRYFQNDIDDFIVSPAETLLIGQQEEITDETIDKLKSIDRTVTVAKINGNNEVMYSYTLEAKELKKELVNNTSFVSKNNIDELTNYTAGVSIVVGERVPSNTNFRLKVSYENDDELNLYKIVDGKLELVGIVTVEDGYVSFELGDAEEYFITKATISNSNVVVKKKNENGIFMISTAIEGLVIVGLIVFIVVVLKRKTSIKEEKVETVRAPISSFVSNNVSFNNEGKDISVGKEDRGNSKRVVSNVSNIASTSNLDDIGSVSRANKVSNDSLNEIVTSDMLPKMGNSN